MLLKNAFVYFPDFCFRKADVRTEGPVIVEVAPEIPGDGTDLCGKKLIPGLIDLHSHGCVGGDWTRADHAMFRKMAGYYGRNGVTSLCATTMSLPPSMLIKAMESIYSFAQGETGGSYLQGINMEGPFFNKEKKGAQAEENLLDPDSMLFDRLQQASGGMIKLCDFAPELPGADAFIDRYKDRVVLSMAHTAASYETAMAAIRRGIRHATHLYNAMTPFTHRSPGVVGAVYDSNVSAEMISDGIHLNPAVVRITFSILGADRVALISDSMEACGMPNGVYELGGQEVTVKDGLATLRSGVIAGSATNQFVCMQRAIQFGVPEETAIRAATYNPAHIIGCDKTAGSIQPGLNADLVVVDDDYTIERVFIRGGELVL